MDCSSLKNIPKRMPAEWESQQCVLMAWPHAGTDWAFDLDGARRQFARIISELARHGDKVVVVASVMTDAVNYLTDWFVEEIGDSHGASNIKVIELPINDTWTRDYGPISVTVGSDATPMALDFGFNAWGLKFPADKDNQVNAGLRGSGLVGSGNYIDCRDFILEGGSIETDGRGTLLTTTECLLNPNRNLTYSRQNIESILTERLGFERYLWLDHGHIAGDDTDSHIDTICRFAPNDVILYTAAGEDDDINNAGLTAMANQLRTFRTADGNPYNLIELPLPDPIYDDEGNRLAATYANFLVTPANVYVPSYGQTRKDRLAAMTMQSVYPDRKVVSIDCRTLIKQGGSLHCSTMQIYPGVFNGI